MSTSQPSTAPKPKSRRGFASMSPERHREIARLGGRASHVSGKAHQFTPEEARAAAIKIHQSDSRKKPG